MATTDGANERAATNLLRVRGHGHQRVTFAELFFDLVYVFAITQLSHGLLEHLSVGGVLQTGLLLLAVWWAWIYTSWVTNWFDPDRRAVRLMLIAVMLVSLIMSAALPRAFADLGLVFALAYATIQIGRPLWVVAHTGTNPMLRRNFQRILAWSAIGGLLWVIGGIVGGAAGGGIWLGALVLEYSSPALGFAVPGLGRARTSDWDVSPSHMAERCQLLVIIALGESILVTGATLAGLSFGIASLVAFVVAFLGSVALWWLYFDRAARDTDRVFEQSADPGGLARIAYTYCHLPIIAGIIVSAVGDELVIAHPSGHTDMATAAVVLGGPALFLFGHILFKWSIMWTVSLSRIIGIAALLVLFPVSFVIAPLLLASAATIVVLGVALADHLLLPAPVPEALALD